MRVLFTGASSFTGYWFVRNLIAAGNEVAATFRGGPDDYEGLRCERVALVRGICEPLEGVRFGDERFLGVIREDGPWDLLCHHGAEVTDYRSRDFNPMAALAANAENLSSVLRALVDAGCCRVLLTGSVFEGGEGAGSQGLPAFSPYGLSKQLTSEVFSYYCSVAGIHLGKFVIPNPFGPYEEPRFTDYLVRTWADGRTAEVRTPSYVRDNIHVSLLAREYVRFAEGLPAEPGLSRRGPCGFAESQGAFALRFAREMRDRLGLPCSLELRPQTDWSEPAVRVNTDIPDYEAHSWDENQAWDELGEYYRGRYGANLPI